MYRYRNQPIEVPSGAGFFDLKLNQPYLVKLPEDVVTLEGQGEVQSYLRRVVNSINNQLPQDWDWSWVVTKDHTGQNYVGTLPKRIARYMYKEWGRKLDAEVLQEIGNIARRNTNKTDSYVFELVSNIDWQDGDFGDRGSCFWSDYEVTKDELLPEYNGNRPCAVRFYRVQDEYETRNIFTRQRITWLCNTTGIEQNYVDVLLPGQMRKWQNCCRQCQRYSEHGHSLSRSYQADVKRGLLKEGTYATYKMTTKETGSGFARSWLACQEGDESFIMFNGYPTNFQLFDQARVLATALGWTYRKISIDSYGTIYLNGDAIRVASPNYDGEINNSFTLHLPEVEEYWCEWCDERVRENNVVITASGQYICDYCYENHAASCEDCNELYHTDNMYWMEGAQRSVCGDCADNYCRCDNCGEDHSDYSMTNVEDTGEYYCEYCVQELYVHSNGLLYTYAESEDDE